MLLYSGVKVELDFTQSISEKIFNLANIFKIGDYLR